MDSSEEFGITFYYHFKYHTNVTLKGYNDFVKILLLEDNAALNRTITKLLEKDNHDVNNFYSGENVLNSKDLFSYHLYILDINVPKK